MIERQKAIQSCFAIPGWCWPRELGAIYDLCAGSTLHLEIGTYCGRSLFAAVAGMQDGRAIAIDPHDAHALADYPLPSLWWPRDVLGATLSALQELRPGVKVEVWNEPALDAARTHSDRGFTSLYLDDNHHYAEMLAHLEAWYGRMEPGGIMLGHDYWAVDVGVMDAVNEFFGTRNLAFEVVSETRIWFHRVPRS